MGDSTSMTIEFLRARLFSERSVSRAARQRANQLAQRVMELEEQLRIVTIQRKKAEKAAAEIFAILESEGFSNFSEVLDSSSGKEDFSDDLKRGRRVSEKEGEPSTVLRMERCEVEGRLSDSEHEVSPSQVKNLSWKTGIGRMQYHEIQKIKQFRLRQQSCFVSALDPSRKHQQGKSCRKIKRRETSYREHYEDKVKEEMSDPSTLITTAVESKEIGVDVCVEEQHGDKEMERVLEERDQLIDQYQAKENAQREWKEKYTENKNSTPEFIEPGKLPPLTKESEMWSIEMTAKNANTDLYLDKETSSDAKTVVTMDCPTTSHNNNDKKAPPTTPEIRRGDDPHNAAVDISNAFVSMATSVGNYKDALIRHDDFTFNARVCSDSSKFLNSDQATLFEKSRWGSQSSSNGLFAGHGFPPNRTDKLFSDDPEKKFSLEIRKSSPRPTDNKLGGILQALQHAKMSLRRQLDTEALNLAPLTHHSRAWNLIQSYEFPITSSRLFTLPSDSFPKGEFSENKLFGHRSELNVNSSSSYYGFATAGENGYQIPIKKNYDLLLGSFSRFQLPLAKTTLEPPRTNVDTIRNLPTKDQFSYDGRGFTDPRLGVRRM